MDVTKDVKSLRTNIEICTRNPVHQCEFRWRIDNATKFTRRLNSHELSDESTCSPRFRVVAKFNEKYPAICNVNIGVQRVDDGKEVIHMDVEVSIVSTRSVFYRTKKLNYTCRSDGSPYYCFSELFTSSKTALTSDVVSNRLVGSYKHEKEVFLLQDDVLIVKGTIKSRGCCVVTETLQPKQIQDEIMPMSHASELLQDLKSAYEENQFTDVELIVEEDTINVHRYILSLRSPVFRRMFDYDTQEKASGKVYITDIEKQVLENFVWYLYTGVVKEESWAFMCALYAAAEKYEVYSLKTACSSILKKVVDSSSVCGILELADLYQDASLKLVAMKYISQHFSGIKNNDEWKSILNHNPKLATEVLTAVTAKS